MHCLSAVFVLLLQPPLTCLYDSRCLKCIASMPIFCCFGHFLLPASMILCLKCTASMPFLCCFCHLLLPASMILGVPNPLPLTCLYNSLCFKYAASVPFLCRFCHLLLPASMLLCVSNALSQWSFFANVGTSSYLPL